MVYRKPSSAGFRLPQGRDGLLDRCRQHMLRATWPKTARDLVDIWYADWRGRKDKPANMTRKHRGWHVDRVAAWLRHHEKAGRLREVDRKGKRNAKRYLQVEGANWGRGKASSLSPRLGENPLKLEPESQAISGI